MFTIHKIIIIKKKQLNFKQLKIQKTSVMSLWRRLQVLFLPLFFTNQTVFDTNSYLLLNTVSCPSDISLHPPPPTKKKRRGERGKWTQHDTCSTSLLSSSLTAIFTSRLRSLLHLLYLSRWICHHRHHSTLWLWSQISSLSLSLSLTVTTTHSNSLKLTTGKDWDYFCANSANKQLP